MGVVLLSRSDSRTGLDCVILNSFSFILANVKSRELILIDSTHGGKHNLFTTSVDVVSFIIGVHLDLDSLWNFVEHVVVVVVGHIHAGLGSLLSLLDTLISLMHRGHLLGSDGFSVREHVSREFVLRVILLNRSSWNLVNMSSVVNVGIILACLFGLFTFLSTKVGGEAASVSGSLNIDLASLGLAVLLLGQFSHVREGGNSETG